MRRRKTVSLIVAAVVVFLVLSALLARALSVGGAEDSAITKLLTAEARGDVARVVALISGCHAAPACQQRAATNAQSLRHAGTVSTILIDPSVGFAVTSAEGTVRVAWLAGSSLPRVQCVRVRRSGNLLEGFTIHLLRVSVRIKSDHACPTSY